MNPENAALAEAIERTENRKLAMKRSWRREIFRLVDEAGLTAHHVGVELGAGWDRHGNRIGDEIRIHIRLDQRAIE